MARQKNGGSENSPQTHETDASIENALCFDDFLNGMSSKILKLDPTIIQAWKENPGILEVRDWMPLPDLPHFTALLGGGIPIGTLTEIYGENGTGKSTLAYKCLRACQEKGGIALLLDSEGSITFDRLEELGVDTQGGRFRYYSISTVEQCDAVLANLFEKFAGYSHPPLVTVVVDSLANLSTNKEHESELTDQDVAWKARLVNKMLRRIVNFLREHQINLIFCNQTYSKVGGMSFGSSPVETPGGKVFKFVATQRIECTKVGQIKNADEPDPIGHVLELKNEKCRTARPKRKIRCAVMYDGSGMSGPWSVFQQLSWKERHAALSSSGAYWAFSESSRRAVPALPEGKFMKKDWLTIYADNKEAIDTLTALTVTDSL